MGLASGERRVSNLRSSLYYVRQDCARGVFEHRFECRRCGQKHAAWRYDWEPGSQR